MPELVDTITIQPEPAPADGLGVGRYARMRPLLGASPHEGEPVDMYVLDATALTYALVNAVKELNTRLVALEGGTP